METRFQEENAIQSFTSSIGDVSPQAIIPSNNFPKSPLVLVRLCNYSGFINYWEQVGIPQEICLWVFSKNQGNLTRSIQRFSLRTTQNFSKMSLCNGTIILIITIGFSYNYTFNFIYPCVVMPNCSRGGFKSPLPFTEFLSNHLEKSYTIHTLHLYVRFYSSMTFIFSRSRTELLKTDRRNGFSVTVNGSRLSASYARLLNLLLILSLASVFKR